MKDNRKPNNTPYFRVMTDRAKDSAELYLYGFIGQEKWWEDDPTEPLTDLEVTRAIKDLEREYKRINIRINSPGGSVMHGDPIISAIKSSPAEIHTYVDGIAASMAFDIWVSATNRHASTHSKMMVHATSSIAIGTAKDMERAAEMLRKFDETSIASMAEATGMDQDEIAARFYDYDDHWLSARDAQDLGLIKEVEGYAVNPPAQEPEKLTFRQLLSVAGRVSWPEGKDENVQRNQDADNLEDWRLDYLRRRDLITKRI
jgi:ATP-dependent Clp protease, protease subunit